MRVKRASTKRGASGKLVSMLLRAVLVLLAGAIAYPQAALPNFEVTDLGILPGFEVSQATAISSNGAVTGYSSNAGFQLYGTTANGYSQGWIWANGTLTPIAPNGQYSIIPLGINKAGLVVGATATLAGIGSFFYQNGTYFSATQPALMQLQADVAISVNDAGQIPLLTNPAAGNEGAALWNNASGILTPLQPPSGGTFLIAYGISGNGQVAGVAALGLSSGHTDLPVVWNSNGLANAFALESGSIQELAFGVNDSGQAVGFIPNKAAGTAHAGLFENGQTSDLGAFDGYLYTFARAINDNGWIAGYGTNTLATDLGSNVIGLADQAGFYVVAKGSGAAFVNIGGTMYDLLSLTENSSGWEFDYAYSINDAGQIVGTGFHNGVQTGFLLTPIKQESMMVSSSANGNGPAIAPGSLASAYGMDLATGDPGSTPLPLPTSFGGTSVSIVDSTGAMSMAPLVYVIPAQVNFEVPQGVASGAAQVTVTSGDGTQSHATVEIAAEAPGVFELNTSGLAAAYVIVYHADGSTTYEPAYTVNSANAIVATPVSLGSATDQAYLFLFGTGFDAAKAATLSIGATKLPAAYVGPQGGYAGLDQVNVLLPQALAGSGAVTLQLTVDGLAANAVNLTIQ